MARMRKRFNQAARQSQSKQTNAVDSKIQISVDSAAFGEPTKYDEANTLVLPSKKRKTVARPADNNSHQKLLSRKQKKKLEKIVERRAKKSNREELLQELQKHQLPVEQYAKLTPLVQVQTDGLKKLFSSFEKNIFDGGIAGSSANKTSRSKDGKGTNKLKYRSWSRRFNSNAISKYNREDPMVLGLISEDSSTESSDEDSSTEGDVDLLQEIDNKNIIIDNHNADPININVTEAEPNSKECDQLIPTGDVRPDIEVVSVTAKTTKRPSQFVHVNRTPSIEAVRSKLPIIPEEQIIMESISENLVTVLAGETGSGKTTQVPQFLYEAGYTLNNRMIGITEPRRVAAIAMSKRVATELNLSNEIVSYQIRFEGNANPKTKIKFMTDGVLLKEMEKDFLLMKYSAICIDEAHERSLYTDILIGLLSRCVQLRQKRKDPLKLVIMSATMRVEDFIENSELFKSPPRLIHVPTRQFPVQIHFNKITPENYILAAYKKAIQIHRKLPPGGILIFLTGQQEVRTLVSKLRKAFPSGSNQSACDILGNQKECLQKRRKKKSEKTKVQLKTFDLDKITTLPLKCGEKDEDEYLSDNSDDFDIDDQSHDNEITNEWHVDGKRENDEPLFVLPLYSMLPSSEQQKVFDQPPTNCRLCVVATNVAETSLTIPSIRYVVDVGKVKTKEWDKLTGVQQFRITWCSKASAEQRSGRAGRTGPGHCYRLYSSAVYDLDFQQHSPPEIVVRPVDDMMLFMKSIGIDKVQNFPFPTHPGYNQLVGAEQTLLNLGAVEVTKRNGAKTSRPSMELTRITDLGKTMAYFPLSPRYSKMLALSFHHSVVEYTVALVAALTVQEVFLDVCMADSNKDTRNIWTKLRRQWAGTGSQLLLGDCMVLLRAVGAFEYEGGSGDFCDKAGLRSKAMFEIRKLRKQLTLETNMLVDQHSELSLDPHMKPPSEKEATLIRQVLLSGLPDRVARKIDEEEIKNDEDKKKLKYAYRCGELEAPVIMHPASMLRSSLPEWVVYQEIFESNGKMCMRGITAIEPSWIPSFCKSLCNIGPPLPHPPPYYDSEKGIMKAYVKSTYGKQGWTLPVHEIEYPFSLEKIKLFSQFLLEGLVFPKLLNWKASLLSLPITMTKPWARLQPRTQKFLQKLTDKRICSKAGLENEWNVNKMFLLEEYLDWLPQELHVEATSSWPPV